MSDDGDTPDWVRDGLRQFADEVRLFLRTALDFTLHPARFAREWASGTRHALNPLGFLATALAVSGAARVLFAHVMHQSDDAGGPWRAALGAVTPFAYYLALGMVQHGVLRLFGSRRRLRDSCGMALYAGGGPALFSQLMIMVGVYVYFRATGFMGVQHFAQRGAFVFIVAAILSFALFLGCLSASQAALHARDRMRAHHVAGATVVALLVTAFVFAVVDPPGDFGLHVVLGPHHGANGVWAFDASLTIR